MSSTGADNITMRENAADNATADKMSANPNPKHKVSHHGVAARKSTASTATAQNSKSNPVVHKKVKRKYSSEGSMTYVSNTGKYSKNKAWALKQGRVNTVANNFLQNGVPKVNVSLQQPTGNEQNSNIKVIITPAMNDFNPQKSPAATGTK